MSHSHRHDDFRFTPATGFRLVIFAAIIFFLISYLSQNRLPQSHLIDPTLSLEETVSPAIAPIIRQITPIFDIIKKEAQAFPQKQIDYLKKSIIQSIYDDLIKK